MSNFIINKFFNLDENKTKIPNETFYAYEKYDGSLGILYWINNEPWIATRGSFTSDQAKWATNWFRNHLAKHKEERSGMSLRFDEDYTFLFEIIYPENRIVCDYGEDEKLVLLAKVHTATGEEETIPENSYNDIECAVRYDQFTSLEDIKKIQDNNREGFVIRFYPSNIRVKVKFEEYKRLHKIVTGVSVKTIWEHMMNNNDSTEALIENVPDEFYAWVLNWQSKLLDKYDEINQHAVDFFMSIQQLRDDRKEFALRAKEFDQPALLFALLDDRKEQYRNHIYKLIKPKYQKVFKIDES